jgi:hypothetical protein
MPPTVTVMRRPGESDSDFMARVDAVAAAGPPAHAGPPRHAVALMPMWLPGHDLTDVSIRAQCECGWYANFDTPITLARVNEVCHILHGPK